MTPVIAVTGMIYDNLGFEKILEWQTKRNQFTGNELVYRRWSELSR